MSRTVECRGPRGDSDAIRRSSDPDTLASYLEDAAHYPGGRCDEVSFPVDEAQVSALVAAGSRVLAVGEQSSLTGGATPAGGAVISTARLNAIGPFGADWVRVGAGVTLAELDVALRERGLYYPPAPTYDGASVGGVVSTNAAGAATFKYGTTRDWVRALEVVLADGSLLSLRRGEAQAAERFEIRRLDGSTFFVPVPAYRRPEVAKCSAGYFSAESLDLVDLFIGSEGTLGIVTEVELGLVAPRPNWLVGFTPLADDRAAVELTAALRSISTREGGALELAAVEYMDARCLDLLREDAIDKRCGVALPESGSVGVIFQIETEADSGVEEELADAMEGVGNGAYAEFARVLSEAGALDETIVALPGDDARRRALFALREGVPEAVNRRIKANQRDIDPSISKCAADPIVPMERLVESLARYREIARAEELDMAIWGHISDGNVHPNIIPASADGCARAKAVVERIGREAIALGGAPMAEHGVGRNPVKQRLLEALYGPAGLSAMRAVKAALDPGGKLAPGVLFPEI